MTDPSDTGVDLGPEERRLVIEAIATLAHLKQNMIDMLLRPARVPPPCYAPFLNRRDERTGHLLSKRQVAPLIIAEIEKLDEGRVILRRIIRRAAEWDSFHLAGDEYEARATVHKARDVLQIVDEMEAREASLREVAREAQARRIQNEAAGRAQRERQEFEEGRIYRLRMFDGLTAIPNHQSRGYLLQDVLNKMFDLHSIPVVRPFTRNDGAEQIDGGFKLDGWHYLVECRWREKLADGRDLDGLAGQVRRSGKQTMGLFLSVEGWSNNVVPVLKQNPDKSIILMHGYDVHAVLSGEVDLRDFILAKAAILSFESEPFLGVSDYTSRTNDGSLPKLAPAGSPAF